MLCKSISVVRRYGRRGRCGAQRGKTRAAAHPVSRGTALRWADTHRQSVALDFGLGNIWTAKRCRRCCRREFRLLLQHFSSMLLSWSQLWCSPSTLTPAMSSGKTERRAACSGSPWPCTVNSTRTKGCEWFLF